MAVEATESLDALFDVQLPQAPYPGLRPFERHEWPVFFGREAMTVEANRRLLALNLLAVHGDSGCGKSSLIRAGVLVQLEQRHARGDQRWRTCTMLPRKGPLRALAHALAGLRAEEPSSELVHDIRRALNAGHAAAARLETLLCTDPAERICILVDQFEELFRYAKETSVDEARLFVDVLTGLLETADARREAGESLRLYAILTMRSEFLGACARFSGLAEAVNRTQYLLPPMERPALLRAIREPASLYDGEVDRALAERLIADAGGDQDQLPLIQHGLMLLWQHKTGDAAPPPADPGPGLEEAAATFASEEPTAVGQLAEADPSFWHDSGPEWRLGLEDYQVGGLAALLSAHADEVMADAAPDPNRKKIVEHLFRALTDINADGHAIRRPQTLAQLRAITAAGDGRSLEILIDDFRADGVSFLTPHGNAPIDESTQIDISHEALIRWWGRIADDEHGWLQREFKDGLIWQALRVQAESFEQDPKSVLSAARTEELKRWVRKLPSSAWTERYGGSWDRVERLMDASRRARIEEARRRRAYEKAERQAAEERAKNAEALLVQERLEAEAAEERAEARLERERLEAEAVAAAEREVATRRITRRTRIGAIVAAVLAIAAVGASVIAYQNWREAAVQAVVAKQQARLANEERARAEQQAELAAERAVEVDLQREVAERKAKEAVDQALRARQERLRAQRYESLFRAEQARNALANGDAITAIQLALAGLPADVDAPWGRPWLPEPAGVLVEATVSIPWRRVLRGHGDAVLAAAFSPDGTRIVGASRDGTVRVWDATSGAELLVLEGHGDWVNAAGYSPDGARIVSGSRDGTVRVWDATSGAELLVLEGHGGGVNAAGYSPDGARIVSGSSDGTVRVWDASSGAQLLVLEGHGEGVSAAGYSPDGARIVSGSGFPDSGDGTVRVWDASSGAQLLVLKARDWVLAAGYSPDGARIVSGSRNGTVRVWDATSGAELLVLEVPEDGVSAAGVSPDGARIVSAGDGTVRVWDATSGAQLLVLEGHGGGVTAAGYSPDGARIVSGWISPDGGDGTVRVWDATSAAELLVLEVPGDGVLAAGYSPDGARIVSGSWDGTMRVWDATSGAELLALEVPGGAVLAAGYSPDGARIVSGSGSLFSGDGTVGVWDATSGAQLLVLEGHGDVVLAAGYSPDGARIVSGSDDGTVRVSDATSGAELLVLEGHWDAVLAAGYSSDGARIVSGSRDGTVRVWDATSGAQLLVLEGPGGAVLAAGYSPDGARIVSGSWDDTMRVWDATSGAELLVLEVPGDGVTAAGYSPDGARIVSGSDDGTVRVWDATSGAQLLVLEGHGDRVWAAGFSPDGARIVSGGEDGTVRVTWIGRSKQELIETARARLPRELTEDERRRYYISAE